MNSRQTAARTLALTLVLAAGASALLAPPAQAAVVRTWTGACSGGCDNHSWAEPANWSPIGVPQTGDSVVVAEPTDVGSLPASISLASLTLRNAGRLVVPAGHTSNITAEYLRLDCMSSTGVDYTATNVIATTGYLYGGSLTVPATGEMVVRYPTSGDDGCVGNSDANFNSIVGRLIMNFTSTLTVNGALHGDGARIVGGVETARLVLGSTSVIGRSSERLILQSLTSQFGGAIRGTGVLVASKSRNISLRGVSLADPPDTERFKLLPGAQMTIRAAASPDTGGTTGVAVSGTLMLTTGSNLTFGHGVDVTGAGAFTGAGTLTVGQPLSPVENITTMAGTQRLSSTTRLVTRGQIRVDGGTSALIAGGPTTLGGIVTVDSGSRLSLGGPTLVTASLIDSRSCCTQRGILEIQRTGTMTLGPAASPLVKYLRVVGNGRLALAGRTLRTDSAVVAVSSTGSVVGPGRIVGNVTSAGTLSLASRGALSISGSLALGSSSRVKLTLGSTALSSDRIAANGALTLGGSLAITTAAATPTALTLMSGASRAGAFSSVTGTPSGSTVRYRASSVQLTRP